VDSFASHPEYTNICQDLSGSESCVRHAKIDGFPGA
jgi:hypothetical protein